MPPSRDHRDPVARRGPRAVVDRRDLGNADAGDDSRRANRPGPDAGLYRVRSRLGERLGGLGGGDVAGDDLDVEALLDPPHRVDHRVRVAVGGVDDEHVDVLLDEGLGTLERVLADADGGGDPEPPLLVLRGERILDALLDVLDRDQALQVAAAVDDRELLDLVPVEDRPRVVERRPDRNGDQPFARHQVRDRLLRCRPRSAGRGSSGCRRAGRSRR